jgi:hypothetical protein
MDKGKKERKGRGGKEEEHAGEERRGHGQEGKKE